MLPTVVSRSGGIEQSAEAVSRGGVALLVSIREYLKTTLADQFEQLPKAARGANRIVGADPTAVFLANGGASGGSDREPSNS